MNIGQHPLTGGMVQQLNKLDMIANNLANLNTTAFKQKNTTTETFSNQISEYNKKIELNIEKNTVYGANFVNQSLNMIPIPGKHYTNNKSGSLVQTGNRYDFAITVEDEFFIVKDPKTNVKFLTRDGSFSPEGENLITKEGYIVVGDNLKAVNTNLQNWEKSIALFKEDYKNLESRGDNLFIVDNKKISDIIQLSDNNYKILQETLETSNINSVTEMTKMIETHRLYEQLSKVSKTLQQIDSTSNNKIGKDG